MGQTGRCGKIGLPPFFVHCHAGGDFAQFLKLRDPEIFIQVKIAVIALCGAGIGAQKIQSSAVRQHNRIAFQINIHFTGNLNDVLFENVRLGLTGGKKHLITRAIGDGYRFSLADRGAYTGVVASWLNTRKPKKKDEVAVKRKRRKKKTSPEKTKKPDEPQGDYLAGEEGNVLSLSHTYANKNNAERAAKAAWEKMQRGVASLSINLARGRADIYPEMPVKVRGFKPEIDGAEWILTRVSHSLNDNGFTSALEFEVKISDVEMRD